MALPSGGRITATDIMTELNQSGSNPRFQISRTAERNLAGKPGNPIKFSDFYGKSNAIVRTTTMTVWSDFVGNQGFWSNSQGFGYGTMNGATSGYQVDTGVYVGALVETGNGVNVTSMVFNSSANSDPYQAIKWGTRNVVNITINGTTIPLTFNTNNNWYEYNGIVYNFALNGSYTVTITG